MNKPPNQLLTRPHMITVLLMLSFLTCLNAFAASKFYTAGKNSNQETQLRIRVAYQLTDVVVRDRNGTFIRGLDADDFILEVDGMSKELKFAEEADGPQNVVLLFDRFNMGDQSLAEAKTSARRIVVEALKPDDRVTILQYNGLVQTLCGWSSERDRIFAALERVGGQNQNQHYHPPRIEVAAPLGGNHYPITNFTYADDEQLRDLFIKKSFSITNYVFSLRAIAEALAEIPGRKTCVLFSEGPNTYYTGYQVDPGYDTNRSRYGGRWRRLTNVAMLAARYSSIMSMDENKYDVILCRSAEIDKGLGGLTGFFEASNTSLCVIKTGPEVPEWRTAVETALHQQMSDAVYKRAHIPEKMKRMTDNRARFLDKLAGVTRGVLFDSNDETDKIHSTIHQLTSEYYILGFEPSGSEAGTHHTVIVRAVNPAHRLVYRRGYFSKQSFLGMDSKQRKAHLEEGILAPGVFNELSLTAKAYKIPLNNGRSSILSFNIDPNALSSGPESGRELEILVSLTDDEGRDRYRRHQVLTVEEPPNPEESLWLNCEVPLLPGWCAACIVVRDNHSGKRSTWNMVFEADENNTGVSCSDLISLQNIREGNLASWTSTDVADEIDVHEPPSQIGLSIPSRLSLNNEVDQEAETNLLLFVNGLGEGFDPAASNINIQYVLDYGSSSSFRLTPADQRISYLASRDLLFVNARLPLGLAQNEKGILSVVVTGIPGGRHAIAGSPYRIRDFDPERAVEFLMDPRIELLK